MFYLKQTIFTIMFGLALFVASHVQAATEFVSIVDPDDAYTTDYSSLSAWEGAVQADLTSAATLVFSYGSATASGTIPDGTTVVGQTSGATASSTHMTASTTSAQVMLTNITGTFQQNEAIYIQGLSASSTYVYLSDAGDSVIAVAECRSTGGSADATMVTISGWTTSATNYIKVWTDPNDVYGRHNGKWDETKYRLSVNDTIALGVLDIGSVDYVYIDGIQIEQISVSSNHGAGGITMEGSSVTSSDNLLSISNCIISQKNVLTTDRYSIYGIYLNDNGNNSITYVYNNLIYGWNDGGMYIDDGDEAYIYNSVFYNNDTDTYNGGRGGVYRNLDTSVVIKNTVSFGNEDGNDGDFTGAMTIDNCASDDGDGTNAIAPANWTNVFEDYQNYNFHLKSTDTDLHDAGTTTIYKYDIDGTARGGAYDIGADEVPVDYTSIICENTSAGGGCTNLDYNTLSDWEDAVEVDLTASTTRVFSGSISTGSLSENDQLNLYNSSDVDTGVDVYVVATTSDQILVDGITGTSTPLVNLSGYYFADFSGGSATQYWAISGTGDALGASARAVGEIDGVWASADTAAVTINSWTSDSDNYIKIYTTDLARHDGKWSDSRYCLDVSTTLAAIYFNDNQTAKIDGLQLKNTYVGSSAVIGANNNITTNVEFSNSIVDGDGYNANRGIGMLSAGTWDIWNVIVFGAVDGIRNQVEGTMNIYNSTIYDCSGDGIESDNLTTRVYNTVVFNNADDFQDSFTVAINSANDDDDGVITAGRQDLNENASDEWTAAFVDYSNGDFHIKDTSSVLYNTGTDGPGSGLYSDDIDGGPRDVDGLGWDIGADELATKIYRSVGNDLSDLSNSATVTITGTTATFSVAQPDNVGVGDVIQLGGSGYYDLAFITARVSSTEYSVQSATGTAPTATSTASMEIYRAYLQLSDWTANVESNVNSGIDATVDENVPAGWDLIASNTIMMVACYASTDGDTTNVTINNWTTGANNYVKVYTPVELTEVGTSQRHAGKWDDDAYSLVVSSGHPIQVRDPHVRLDGLQVFLNNPTTYRYVFTLLFADSNGEVSISNNIVKSNNSTIAHRAVTDNIGVGANFTLKVWNNLFYDFEKTDTNTRIIYLNDADTTAYIYNNTFVNGSVGIDCGNALVYAINNLIQDMVYGFNGTFDSSSDYNISNISGDQPASGSNDLMGVTVSFIDEANDDFRLSPNDTTAIDVGTSSPRDSIAALQNDIDGNYRRDWDIGADEASINFSSTVMESGGEFTSLSAWESANQVDLTADDTAVFSIASSTGWIPVGSSVTGVTSGATASTTVVATSSNKILLYNISGTFVNGEDVQLDGATSNAVELSNTGNPAIAVAKIDGAWSIDDNSQLIVSGWTTGVNNYIKIYTTDSARHDGKWSDSKYRLSYTSNTLYVDNGTNRLDIWVEGLQIKNTSASSIFNVNSCGAGSVVRLKNSYLKNVNTSTIYNSNSLYGKHYIQNSIIISPDNGALHGIRGSWEELHLYNSVVTGIADDAVESDGQPTYVINSAIFNNHDDFRDSFTLIDHCASDDGDGTSAVTPTNWDNVFVDYQNGDFHLKTTDSDLRNAGIDLSATSSLSFTTDIDGTARGASWDIGADELPTTYTSIICENTSAGGNCSDMDYSTLQSWETAVDSSIASSSTRVFGGAGTGLLSENDAVYLTDATGTTTATGFVVATTSDQILIDGITSSTTLPVIASTSYIWRKDASNYWSVSGNDDDFGASAQVTAEIDGAWSIADTQPFSITGWETDNDNYLKIYTTDLARHNGKWDDSKYRLDIDSYYVIYNYEEYSRIDGLQIKLTSTGNSWPIAILLRANSNNSDLRVSDNIITADLTGLYNNGSGIRSSYVGGYIQNGKIWNNIIYNWTSTSSNSGGIGLSASVDHEQNWDVYNNTIYDCDFGIYSAASYSNVIAINNLVASTTDPFSGTFVAGTDYNATDINDDPGVGGNNIASATVNFISTASGTEDFHLTESNSDLINAGFDLTASTSLFTTDIDGGTRDVDGLGWDIGADEVATKIYRSVGNDSSDLSNSATVTISGTTATFSVAQPDNVGVGDVIQFGGSGYYDLAFITARASSTEYSVQTFDGSAPTATTTADMTIRRAYLELNDWETNTSASVSSGIDPTVEAHVPVSLDLVASNTIMMIACYASDTVDDAEVSINGWTTGANNRLILFTPYLSTQVGQSQRHDGKWDTSKYYIQLPSSITLQLVVPYVTIDGLQFNNTRTSNAENSVIYAGNSYANNIIVKNNIFIRTGTRPTGVAVGLPDAATYNNYIYNNIVDGYPRGINVRADTDADASYIFNNTVTNCDEGIYVRGNYVRAKNNIAVNNSTIDFTTNAGSYHSESGNNISSDATAPGSNSIINATVKFVDAANDDFHLHPEDIVAIDAGTSTPSSIFTDDIDGNYRRQWDIGADEASINFSSTVMESDGEFSSLSAWEAANQVDLIDDNTAAFSIIGVNVEGEPNGWIPVGSSVTGATSGATASTTVVATSSNKILLYNISGIFVSGEQVQLDGATSNNVTLSNAGNPAIAVAKIDGAWSGADTTAVTIAGWTTGVNNYIKVYTIDTARHNGKWDDSKYRIVFDGFAVLSIEECFVKLDGLQVFNQRLVSDSLGLSFSNSDTDLYSEFYASNNIIKGNNPSTATHRGIGILGCDAGVGSNAYIWNNVIYDIGTNSSNVFGIRSADKWNAYVYNNTVYNSYIGYEQRDDSHFGFIFKNNIAQNTTIGFNKAWTFNSASDYNLSDNGYITDGANDLSSTTVQFVDATNNDFHLSILDTSARNNGTTTTGDINYHYDIDGTARGASWDIGADELPTTYTSIICEGASAGGNCSDMDYSTLSEWEDAVETNLASSSTRVFGGTGTGLLSENDVVYLLDASGTSTAKGYVVATTSDQILIDGIVGSTTLPVTAGASYVWQLDASNYWSVSGTADDFGASVQVTAEIDGTWSVADTVEVDVDGWNVDNDNYIKIYTTLIARHNGKWNSTRYRLVNSGYRNLNIDEDYVRVDGLQISGDRADGTAYGIDMTGLGDYGDLRISNNIIEHQGDTTFYGISCGDNEIVYKIFNNIIYNNVSLSRGINGNGSANIYAYNNTIYGATGWGINDGGTGWILKNNLVIGSSNGYSGSASSTASTNNISDISSDAPGQNSIYTIQTDDQIFVSSSTYDFHIVENSDAVNAGVNLSNDQYLNFLTDIDGGTRNVDGLGWDIGADEVATKIYRSVGNDSSDLSTSATVTISATTATFSSAQPNNVGVGDVIQYGGTGYYKVAFISARTSSTEYSVQAHNGSAPTATTTAPMNIYRAHLELNDWEDQLVAQVNTAIDDTIDDTILVGMDLVASNTVIMVACYASDDGDDNFTVINDWTTGGNNYIKVYTPVDADEVGVSQRHNGKWNTSYYYLATNEQWGAPIEAFSDNIRITGLQVENVYSNSVANNRGMELNGGGEYHVESCIIRYMQLSDNVDSQAKAGIYFDGISANAVVKIWNNIIYNFGAGIFYANGNSVSGSISNNTFIDNKVYGVSIGAGAAVNNVYLYNNIIQNSGIQDFYLANIEGSDNNISSDATSPDGVSFQGVDIEFIDEINDNFHLSSTDTKAVDTGISIPVIASISEAVHDIDGNYRRQWDIGADEASINFDSTVMESDGEFSSLSAWESANQVDLVDDDTAVFSIASSTGWIPVGSSVTGAISGATASTTVVATSSNKTLLYDILGTFESGEDVCLEAGNVGEAFAIVREQYDTDSNTTASATFGSTPTVGNLLVAITTMRVGEDAGLNTASISGSGWTRAINEHFKTGGSTSDRRGLAMFYKIAGASEPTNIQTEWDPSGINNLIITEYSSSVGTFNFDTATSSNSGTSAVTSRTTGTTNTSAQNSSLIITGLVSRDETESASWTNSVDSNIQYFTNSITAQTAFGTSTSQGTKESTASWSTSRLASAGILVFSILESASTNCVTISNAGNPAIAVAKIDGAWSSADTSAVTIDGWTTGANNYIKVYTTDSARHQGRWSDSKYRLVISIANSPVNIIESNVKVDGLQIATNNSSGSTYGYRIDSLRTGLELSNSIIKNSGIGLNGIYLSGLSDGSELTVWNVIVYDFVTNGIREDYSTGSTLNVYNSTVYNCGQRGVGEQSSGVVTVKNSIAFGNDTDFDGTFNSASSNNISSDATAPGTNSMTTTTVQFADSENNDYHLSASDTSARNNGTTTTGDINYYYDIDDTARGASWDIGADELPITYTSIICENTSAGGGCADMDYSTLSDWEDAVETNLASSSTRVFGGSGTGLLSENDLVYLLDATGTSTASGRVVATTSDQILIDEIVGSTTLPVTASTSYVWRKDASNYWSVSGTDDDFGANVQVTAEIDGSWSGYEYAAIDIDGWNTDQDNYIKVYTTLVARHNGKWDDTKYVLSRISASNYSLIRIFEDYTKIEGLQGSLGGTADYRKGFNIIASYCSIYNNIVIATSSSGGLSEQAIDIDSHVSNKVYNNIIYGINTSSNPRAINIDSSINGSVYIYNNTIYDSTVGLYTGYQDAIAINNLVASTTNPYSGTFYTGTDYNATDIDDHIGTGSNNSTSTTFTFKDVANNDFRLVYADTGAKDQGTDLSTDANLSITDDAKGATRPFNNAFDIGADEYSEVVIYRSVGPSNTSALACGGGTNNINISSSTSLVTFDTGIANNIGVGDALVYNSSSSIAFISGRTSTSTFTVKTTAGINPGDTTNDSGWCLYRAYTSLSNAEAGTTNTAIPVSFDVWSDGRDLVANQEQWNIACYGDAVDTDQVVINDWMTGEDNYLKIYSPVGLGEVGTSQRHTGKAGTGYRIVETDNSLVINNYEDYVRIEGIEVDNSSNTGTVGPTGVYIRSEVIGDIYISSCIFHADPNDATATWGLRDASSVGNRYYYNNIIYNVDRGMSDEASGTSNNAYFYNNSFIDVGVGIFLSSSATNKIAINNLIHNPTSSGYPAYRGAFDSSSDYNISSNDDSTGGSHDKINQNILFVDEINNDFHLAPTDTAAIDAGTSTISSLLTTDIDGHQIRTYDIGADDASINFDSSVMESGGEFSSLSAWEAANQVDLTADDTAVFSIASSTGWIPLGSNVTGVTSSATASTTVVATSSMKILLYNISGTFVSGEDVQLDGATSNAVELADGGNPAIAVAKIDGVWSNADENQVVIDGWTTNINNYIKIYTTDSARHDGKWNDSKYRLEVEVGYDGAINIGNKDVVVDGLQVNNTRTVSSWVAGINNTANNGEVKQIVKNNIIKTLDITHNSTGIHFYDIEDGLDVKIYNNIIVDFSYGINVHGAGGTKDFNALIANNTINIGLSVSSVYGIVFQRSSGYFKIVNNIVEGFSDFSDYVINYIDGATDVSGNNISSDASAYGANPITNATVQFVDENNYNFHLSPLDTTARNAGSSTISQFSNFSVSNLFYDIDGTARGASWDIGADELPTTYTSIICENTVAGGNCSDMDYSTMSSWEDAVEANLASSSTRVFGGTGTGLLSENDAVYLTDASGTTTAIGFVVATTSDQILIDGIVGSTTLPVTASTSYVWRKDASNYWSVSGTGDAFGASVQVTAEIDGAWSVADTAEVYIADWTTDNDNYIKIYTTDTARHDGKWNDAKYNMEPPSNQSAITVQENYIKIDGLQINRSGSDTYEYGIDIIPASIGGDMEISNNIIKSNKTTIAHRGINYGVVEGRAVYLKIWNNIIYNFENTDANTRLINLRGDELTAYVYNNTVYGGYNGIYITSSPKEIIVKNNIVASTTNAFSGAFANGTNYNATDDSGAPGIGTNYTNQTFSFVSTASGTEDFHLLDSDTGAKNKGADLSSTSTLSFATDIDGGTRNVDDLGWDIGADEVATKIYRSVGNDSSDLSNSATVTISGTTATFSAAQPNNVGVGDVIQFGGAGYYKVAFISGRASSTEYSVQAHDGSAPTATTTASMNIYRAHLELNDWEDQLVAQVNSGIDDTIDDTILVGMDLVASNTVMMVACYASDDGDDTVITVDDWTTGVNNYIKIYTPVDSDEVGTSQRHDGKWDDNRYYLTNTVNEVLHIFDEYVRINGLQIAENSSNHYGIEINYVSEGVFYITNNIIRSVSGEGGLGIVPSDVDIDKVYIYNNIIYGGWGEGIRASAPQQSYIYNNTIIGCENYGIRGTNDVDRTFVVNIIIIDTTSQNDWFLIPGGSSYNNLSNGEAPPGSYGIQGEPAFIDKVNHDYHLSPTDTVAVDAGTSTPSSIFTDDIDGNYRRTWDIGADEASIYFDSTVMESDGEFSSLSAWETANQVDLVDDDTAVFSIIDASNPEGPNGWIPVGSSVTGATSGATASTTVVATSSNKILLYNISGTFVSGEQVQLDGATSNNVTLSNGGNPAIAVAKIDGAWTSAEDDSIDINGFTTGINNYIRIYTTDTARHQGQWNENKYRLEYNSRGNEYSPIEIYDDYVRIDGLQIYAAYDGMSGEDFQDGINIYNTGAEISNCIIKKLNSDNYVGIRFSEVPHNGEVKIYNNIIYNFGYGVYSNHRWVSVKQKAYIFNNTIIDSSIMIRFNTDNGNDVYLYNNLVQNSGGSDYPFYDNINTSNNMSADVTSPDGTSFQNASVSFVDEANYDYHLSTIDVTAKNAGTSSVTSYGSDILTDIDGDTRYDYGFDIGADEAPTVIHRSVGRHEYDLAVSGTLVTIADNVATLSQDSPSNVGVGDVLQIGTGTPYQMAVIRSRVSTTSFGVYNKDGESATATTSAPVSIFRAHSLLDDWEDQLVGQVNSAIDASIDDDVLVKQDLTASNTAMFVSCYASTTADTGGINIDGWETGTSTYVKIYTPFSLSEVGVSQRHSGKLNSTKYTLEKDGGILNISDNYIKIHGLQFHNTDVDDWGISIGNIGALTGKADIEIYNNIIKHDNASGSNNRGIDLRGDTPGSIARIVNNVIYGITNDVAIQFQDSDFTYYVYNNTISGCTHGLYGMGGTIIAKNNVLFNNTYDFTGTFDTLDYNASDDGDGDNAIDISPGAVETDEWAKAFTDYANGDFTIRNIYSVLFDAGTTITIVDDDIIGNARPYYEGYDVGAFEYYSGKAKYRLSPGGALKMQGTIKFK